MRMGLLEMSVSSSGRLSIATQFNRWLLSSKEWIHLISYLVMIIGGCVVCVCVRVHMRVCVCMCSLHVCGVCMHKRSA